MPHRRPAEGTLGGTPQRRALLAVAIVLASALAGALLARRLAEETRSLLPLAAAERTLTPTRDRPGSERTLTPTASGLHPRMTLIPGGWEPGLKITLIPTPSRKGR